MHRWEIAVPKERWNQQEPSQGLLTVKIFVTGLYDIYNRN